MPRVVDRETDLERLTLQRKLKKDLQIGDFPRLDKLLYFFSLCLKLHLIFIATWMFGSASSHKFGQFLGRIVSPLADIAFWFHPHYETQRHFEGSMGADFYRNIVGETFFMGAFLGILTTIGYLGRYIKKPWRFSQYVLEQWRIKASWPGAIILSTFGALISFGVGFCIAVWYGLMAVPYEPGSIALFQLGLWSVFASAILYVFVLFVLITLSSVFYLLKLMGNFLFRII